MLPAEEHSRLAGPQVAAVLEAMAQLAPATPVRSLAPIVRPGPLTEARTCYDHLAGRRGVELRDRLLAADALRGLRVSPDYDQRVEAWLPTPT